MKKTKKKAAKKKTLKKVVKKNMVAKATHKVVISYECTLCGHHWSEDYGRLIDISGYEPSEDEEIDCPKCETVLIIKLQGY